MPVENSNMLFTESMVSGRDRDSLIPNTTGFSHQSGRALDSLGLVGSLKEESGGGGTLLPEAVALE